MGRLAAITWWVLWTGCAGLQRDAFIHQQAGDYVYAVPVQTVWPHVLELIGEEGFSIREEPGRNLLTTEWREEMSSSTIAASFTRYLVEAVALDDGHTRVRIIRHSMTVGGGPGFVDGDRHAAAARAYANPSPTGRAARTSSGARDLRMEWLLLRRVAPTDAAELQQLAEARYR